VWQKLEADVAGAVPLSIGEVTLDDQSARRALAEAIGAWIEGAENPTMIRDQLDLLPLLDDITSSEPTGDMTPAVCEPGELFPTDGTLYDQSGPLIAFVAPTPAADAFVTGAITVRAEASDPTDPTPSIRFTAPAAIADADTDGDPADADCTATVDTTAMADGPVVIWAESADSAGNTRLSSRRVVADNTRPVITVAVCPPAIRATPTRA
jgi:hypothetical protein